MGDDDTVAAPDGGSEPSRGRGTGAREASDADVRAAVESVSREPGGRVQIDGTSSADAVASGEATDDGVTAGPPGEDWTDTGTTGEPLVRPDGTPDPDLDLDLDLDPGPSPDPDPGPEGDAGAADDIAGVTPTVAAVGGGLGVGTVGVLLVAYRTLLAAGADRFVAALYGAGGLLIVAGFVTHALWRADEVDV